jgi:chaperonin GroEL (HSP60 family)
MKNGIDKAVKIVVEKLEEITTHIETKEEIAQVATNSAQNSEI